MKYQTRILCCQLHAWPAPFSSEKQGSFANGNGGVGRERKMKINHTHTLYELYHFLTSSARSQLVMPPEGLVQADVCVGAWGRGGELLPEPRSQLTRPELIVQKRCEMREWERGRGNQDPCFTGPAASSAAREIRVLRSVWRESGSGVRDSRLTARSS
jgi:hypothetical protein